jgi:FMN-dependent NADH-azoreductase
VVIASSRGGVYTQGSPYASIDFQENYLGAVFGFLGIADVQVVRAEGLNLGSEQRQAAMDAAIGEATRHAA